MANIESIEKSLNNIQAVIKAADGVIRNPQTDFQSELRKQGASYSPLVTALATSGSMGLVAATGALTISGSIAGLLGGMGAAATAATVSGPIGWAIGGAALLLLGGTAYKKYQRIQRAQQEKERMKNEIIRKQQAIINKLKSQHNLNQQEIKNLKETLKILEDFVGNLKKAA